MTDIPVKNTPPIVTTTAIAGQTVFSFPFLILAENQLVVQRLPSGSTIAETLTLASDYTIEKIQQADGSTITLDPVAFPSGATAGDRFTLFRSIPVQRLADFPFGGRFRARSINLEQDTEILIAQELQRDIGRAFTLQPADALAEIQLPLDTERRGKFLAFEDTAEARPIVAAGTSASLGPVSAFIDTLLDDVDEATARGTLGAVGLTGNESIAGNKTFSGSSAFSGQATFNGPLILGDRSELTLAADAITPTGNEHRVDTQNDDAADDLITINTTNLPDGSLLLLRPENPARVVTVKHGIGNVDLVHDQDIVMNDASSSLLLRLQGTTWREVNRTPTVRKLVNTNVDMSGGLTDIPLLANLKVEPDQIILYPRFVRISAASARMQLVLEIASGFVTTDYDSDCHFTSSTTTFRNTSTSGFIWAEGGASLPANSDLNGELVLRNLGGNRWGFFGDVYLPNDSTARRARASGEVSLGGALVGLKAQVLNAGNHNNGNMRVAHNGVA